MLFIKDFRTTVTSYNLVLEDSETKVLLEKVYDYSDDEFGGVESKAAYAMLDDINNSKYEITLNIKTNNFTLALLDILNEYMKNKYVLLDFNRFKNASPTFPTEKLYAALNNNNSISYIIDYKEENNKISFTTINETAKDYNIISQHFNLIKETGEYNGKKLRKFNRVQLLALIFMSKNFKSDIFTL